MTAPEPRTIVGHYDRVTGRPATIFTPPEDLVERITDANGDELENGTSDGELIDCPVCQEQVYGGAS